jgi:hypothetical protein
LGQFLTTGGAADPFLPRLKQAIRRADRIDLAVAFIKSSGLALIYPALADAVEIRGARLRVLTSDYLDVTDPGIKMGTEIKMGTYHEYSGFQHCATKQNPFSRAAALPRHACSRLCRLAPCTGGRAAEPGAEAEPRHQSVLRRYRTAAGRRAPTGARHRWSGVARARGQGWRPARDRGQADPGSPTLAMPRSPRQTGLDPAAVAALRDPRVGPAGRTALLDGSQLGVLIGRTGSSARLARWKTHHLSAALLLTAQNILIDCCCIVVERRGVLLSQPTHFGEVRVFLHYLHLCRFPNRSAGA